MQKWLYIAEFLCNKRQLSKINDFLKKKTKFKYFVGWSDFNYPRDKLWGYSLLMVLFLKLKGIINKHHISINSWFVGITLAWLHTLRLPQNQCIEHNENAEKFRLLHCRHYVCSKDLSIQHRQIPFERFRTHVPNFLHLWHRAYIVVMCSGARGAIKPYKHKII